MAAATSIRSSPASDFSRGRPESAWRSAPAGCSRRAAATTTAAAPRRPARRRAAGGHQARRRPARGPRRRGQGRVVQPGPRRRVDRHVAPVPDLRPAHARRPRPDAVAGPRARVEPERRRHGLRGQAPPRRRLPQRQVVHRRRRHLLAPADGRREAPRPLRGHEHQPRRAQEARRPDRADPAEEPDRRPGGRVRERHHGDGAGRRDRLHATRSARGRSSSTRSRPASAAIRCANKNYWEEGKPYVDAWEDISIDDDDAPAERAALAARSTR